MAISITNKQLEYVETLLTVGSKEDAIKTIESLITQYFSDILQAGDAYEYALSEDEDKSSPSYDIGNKLRNLLDRIRQECPDECSASSCELLNFQPGDRVYGFNRDESAVLYALGPSIGEGNLVIDHVNDTFREGGVIDPRRSSTYGMCAWKDDADLPIQKQAEVVKDYSEFYKAVPKLAELPQQAVNLSTDQDQAVKMINRACKAGILKTVLDGSTVHFNIDTILSDLKYQEMAIDKGEKTAKALIETFYTVKELRFVKRLVELRPDFGERIQFYQKGHKVPAPWVQFPELWARYKRSETSKSLETTLEAIAAAQMNLKRQLVVAAAEVDKVVSDSINDQGSYKKFDLG